MYIQDDIAFHFGTPKQRVKAINFDICKNLPKLIGYHNNLLSGYDKIMSI